MVLFGLGKIFAAAVSRKQNENHTSYTDAQWPLTSLKTGVLVVYLESFFPFNLLIISWWNGPYADMLCLLHVFLLLFIDTVVKNLSQQYFYRVEVETQ